MNSVPTLRNRRKYRGFRNTRDVFSNESGRSSGSPFVSQALTLARRASWRCPHPSRRADASREGADPDINIFDPARVIDRATFREPALPSDGVRHVPVDGVPVVRDGRLLPGVLPGRPLLAAARRS